MKFLYIPLLMLFLSACNPQAIKQEEADSSGPVDPIEIERLADQAYQEKNWAVSEVNYIKIARALPTESKPWFRLGNIYAYTNRPDDAVLAYREALVRKPDFTKAWHNMGVVQLKETARTFSQLTIHANSDSPLYGKSEIIYQGLMDLLNQEQETQ